MLPNRFSLLLLCGLLLLVFILLSCKWLGKKDKPAVSIKNNPNQTMPIPTLPITGDYADEWKIVDSLEQQGLFKSALEKVESIQKRASGDKNSQQTVKCLIFIGKYTAQMEEDGLAKAIQTFEKEAAGARQPERSLMQSLLGQLYATYLQNNSWQLRSRTPIPDGEGGDILTWSAAQIEKQALELYSTSLKEEALLSTVPLSEFKDVLQPTQHDSVMGQPLWSNLFELLAQRAITHFSNERSYLSEPAYAFVLNQPEAFTDWETFKNTAFETKDTDSGKWRAIQLFQRLYKLIKINPNGDQTVAKARLFDLELKRLNFVFTNSVLENQNDLYRSALEKLKIQSENHPSNPEIVFYLADHVF
ncbi:MAG: hypothetical protein JNJ57_07340, partial [Saprospiraceae bacterium]|nr:hypothetical protein [Saprospiraceae bacterium]